MTIEHLETLLRRYAACLPEQRLLRDATKAAVERRLARDSEDNSRCQAAERASTWRCWPKPGR